MLEIFRGAVALIDEIDWVKCSVFSNPAFAEPSSFHHEQGDAPTEEWAALALWTCETTGFGWSHCNLTSHCVLTRSIQVLQSMCVILNHNLFLSWACYSLAYSRLAYSNHNNAIATSYLRSRASTGLVLSVRSDHANAGSAATGRLNFDPRWQQQNLACTQLSSHAWVLASLLPHCLSCIQIQLAACFSAFQGDGGSWDA